MTALSAGEKYGAFAKAKNRVSSKKKSHYL